MADKKLFDEVLAQTLDILRLSAGERAAMMRRLKRLERELIAMLSEELESGYSKTKAERVAKRAKRIIEEHYNSAQIAIDFAAIGEAVALATGSALQVVLGAETVGTPLASYYKTLASDVLIEGSPAAEWWQAQSADVRRRFVAQVRQGLANGETNQQIIARIVGKSGIPGVMQIAQRNAAALVQTSVQAVANTARLEVFRANADVISAVKQVSTLDSHTSIICVAYSEKMWKLDGTPIAGAPPFNGGPPRHFNCRSVLVPVTKTFRELGIDIDEPQLSERASDSGPIDAKTTFNDYLKRRGKAYQDEVLGPGRAELWRKGRITLRDLVNGEGNPLSLAELQRRFGVP